MIGHNTELPRRSQTALLPYETLAGTMRTIVALFLFALFLSAQTPYMQPPPSQPPIDDLTILYTGKLLGYARMPDIQYAQQWGWMVNGHPKPASAEIEKQCAAPKADCQRLYTFRQQGDPSAAAKALTAFLAAERKAAGPHSLLLGSGDNFAMDYFARVVVAENFGGSQQYIGKDELFFDQDTGYWLSLHGINGGPVYKKIQEAQEKGNTRIPFDNVAAFYTAAKYDALVPGKHDFYYGPERLRQLARLTGESGTQILAANLILQSKPAEQVVSAADFLRARRRNFETSVGATKWSLPKNILPWARKFRLKSFGTTVDPQAVATLCSTDDRDQKPAKCTPLSLSAVPDDKDLIFELKGREPIPSERTYTLCVPLRAPADKQKPELCQAIDVSTPFFQYPDVADAGYVGGRKRTTPINVAIRKTGVLPWLSRKGAVVMGVVEPGIESKIGSLNTVYVDKDASIDTVVVSIDPMEALTQMLDFCQAAGYCDPPKTPDTHPRPLVLLAQMSRDEAATLNARMKHRFSLVVAQADNSFPTAAAEVTYSAGHRPIAVVPRELADVDENNRPIQKVQLNVARLTGLTSQPAPHLATRAPDPATIPLNGLTAPDCLTSPVQTAWNKATANAPSSDDATRFRTVVLHSLRDAFHADVALIQDRDFYDLGNRLNVCQNTPVTSAPGILRASVEQILWKGDLAVTRTITGAALKAVLKESDRLRRAEENSYAPQAESRRWLQTLGISQDAETKAYYVNGRPIEDKTTYSVAMTDFLASGDTGFSDLRNPAVPPATRPRDLHTLFRLSEIVVASLRNQPIENGLQASAYLDHISHGAFPQAAPATFSDHIAAIWRGFGVKRPSLASPVDRIGQTRPFTRIFLDKSEFSFTDYRHNKPNHDLLNTEFAGTSQGGVLTRKNGTLPIAIQAEVRRERTTNYFFARHELEYTRTTTQQDGPEGRFLTTYPSNRISFESGLRATFHGSLRTRPWYGWLLSGYTETNLHVPFADGLNAGVAPGCDATNGACPSKLTFRSELPRTSRYLAKTGFRRENEENWFEAGVFSGIVQRPAKFAVLLDAKPVRDNVTCDLNNLVKDSKPITLNSCLSSTFPVALPTSADATAYTARLSLAGKLAAKAETGVFLNFNFRLPVPRNPVVKDLYFEQRGSWFVNHSGDSVVDSRLNEKLLFGPTITLIPNLPGLSLRPTYTLFFYENKQVRALLAGRTLDIKLDYRFDWKTGASWKQVLRYGRPK